MRRSSIGVLCLGVLVVGLAAANRGRGPASSAVDWRIFQPPPVSVTVERPTRGPIARSIAARGIVEPAREARVTARAPGKVAAVLVEEGDEVKAGAILARLDDSAARDRLDQARSRREKARVELPKAEAASKGADGESERLGSLLGRGLPPSEPLAGAPARAGAARATLEAWRRESAAAEAALKVAEGEVDRLAIKAPIGGVVEDLHLAVGDDLSPGLPGVEGPPLLTILDLSRLKVRAWIDEADARLVRPGQEARVYLPSDPKSSLKGRVDRVALRGRPVGEVVSYAATFEVDDPGHLLLAGMRAIVEVEVRREPDALRVPVQAVLQRRRKDLAESEAIRAGTPDADPSGYVKLVYVVRSGRAVVRPVETGLGDDRLVQILRGLSDRDEVVVGPFRSLEELKEGKAVVLGSGDPRSRGLGTR